MGWIVFTVIMLLIAAATWKIRYGKHPSPRPNNADYMEVDFNLQSGFRVFTWPIIGLWLLASVFMSISVVEAGQLGLVKTFKEYTGTMSPGLHLKAPWQSVEKVNGRVQKATVNLTGGGKGSAVSRETQPVYAKLVVNYRIDLDQSMQLYTDVGPDYYNTIIEPVVQQSFKAITVKYSTVDIAPKREEIRKAARELIDEQLAKHGINVDDLLIKDLNFSKDFVNAIEDKQVATEEAKAAQERVATAKANANAARETARGEADAIEIKGRALKENPQSIELAAIEKLNPNVELIYVPSDGSMILQTPSTGGR